MNEELKKLLTCRVAALLSLQQIEKQLEDNKQAIKKQWGSINNKKEHFVVNIGQEHYIVKIYFEDYELQVRLLAQAEM